MLVVGNTYYRITYADRDMTMIGVDPLVYLGDVTSSEGEVLHAFQDTVSYVRFGSRLGPEAVDDEDIDVFFISQHEIGEDLVELEGVVAAATASLKRQREVGFPLLPILKQGWRAAT